MNWVFLAIAAYTMYAVSNAIDKHVMREHSEALDVNLYKTISNAVVVGVIGLLFFDLNITKPAILWSAGIGVLLSGSGVCYFQGLRLKDAEVVIPYIVSVRILLVFVGALIFLSEIPSVLNAFGVALILGGLFGVIATKKMGLPRFDRGFGYMSVNIALSVIAILLLKPALKQVDAITLTFMMYIVSIIILVTYHSFAPGLPRRLTNWSPAIGVSSIFGAGGSLLLLTAFSVADASKVYPLAGLQTLFLVIIAAFVLKERFTLPRFAGAMAVGAGIFLVAL